MLGVLLTVTCIHNNKGICEAYFWISDGHFIDEVICENRCWVLIYENKWDKNIDNT